MALQAVTKSYSRMEMVAPLAIRAIRGVRASPMETMRLVNPGPMTAININPRRRVGKDMKMSINLTRIPSILRPK